MSAGVRSASDPCRLASRAAVRGILAAIALSIACLASGNVASVGAQEVDMADLFLVDDDGDWMCGAHNPRVRCSDEHDSEQAAEKLLTSLAGVARPNLYLRVAKARNECAQHGPCMTAVPDPARHPDVLAKLQALHDLQIKLGVVIGADQDGDAGARNAKNVARQACAITAADTNGIYDFIFLDMTLHVSKPALIRIVHAIKKGTTAGGGPCPGGRRARRGWGKVIVNDNHSATLQTGAWGHAHSLSLLGDKVKAAEVRSAALGEASVLRPRDLRFVEQVKALDDGSRAVLRLEVPPATSRFAGLKQEIQCALLTRWARRQQRGHFTFIYPLYVHGVDSTPYDSFQLGTFGLQRQLMDLYPATTAVHLNGCTLVAGDRPRPTPAAPPPSPAPAVRVAGVEAKAATEIACRSARLHGWVNPHGAPTSFHFEYYARADQVQRTGTGDAGAALERNDVSRVADHLEPGTRYSAVLIADNAGGRATSNVVSFATPAKCR